MTHLRGEKEHKEHRMYKGKLVWLQQNKVKNEMRPVKKRQGADDMK